MKKLLLSVSALFIASSAFALDCSYLDNAQGKFKKEDLPCVTQELPPLMKTLMGTPLKIDEITSLVDIYETIPGKEITFFYQIDSSVKFDTNKIPSLKETMKSNLVDLNCYDPYMREVFDLGINFKYSYNQLNKNLFENIVDKDTCKDISIGVNARMNENQIQTSDAEEEIKKLKEEEIKKLKEDLKQVKEQLKSIKNVETTNPVKPSIIK